MINHLKTRWLVITVVLDMLLTAGALLLARVMREYLPAGVYLEMPFTFAELDEPLHFPLVLLLAVIISVWLLVFSSLSIYNVKSVLHQYHQIRPIVVAITGAILVFMGLAYLFFRELSRFLFFYFYLLDIVFLIGWRQLTYRLFQNDLLKGWYPRHRVLIVGEGEFAENVAAAVKQFAWSGLEVIGLVNNDSRAVGKVEQLVELVAQLEIDEVIFALPPERRKLLQALIFELQPLPVNIRLVPDVIDLVFARATIEDFAGLPLIGLHEPALSIVERLLKRTFDIVAACLLLILSTPLLGVIILGLKYTVKGSVFYSAQRVGEGGQQFTMYKFRTMVADADEAEGHLLTCTNGQMGVNKQPNDPRVTRIGRLLRRTSLDELPQLINVLKGEMSLVGPRPELPWLVEHYEPWQHQRFAVPQGMTGWWQVKNRNHQLAYDVRVEDDLYYIHNYSFALDLRILWLTLGAIIRGDGAY